MQDVKEARLLAFHEGHGLLYVDIEDHEIASYEIVYDTADDEANFLFDDGYAIAEIYSSEVDEEGNQPITHLEIRYGVLDAWSESEGGNDGMLDGKGGDDLIVGGEGADVLIGGPGADEIYGDALWARVAYEINDQGEYAPVSHSIVGQVGFTYGNDILQGGPGADYLDGGGGVNLLDGGAGNDILMGVGNYDLMRGGEGVDEFYINAYRTGATRILDFDQGGAETIFINRQTGLGKIFTIAERHGVDLDLAWFATETEAGVTIAVSGIHDLVIDGADLADLEILPVDAAVWGPWLLIA